MWTESIVSELRAMWSGGYSASIIGGKLGFSRNAILGKVHRLGLETRAGIEFRKERQATEKIRKLKAGPPAKKLDLRLPSSIPTRLRFVRPRSAQLTKSELRAMLTQAVKNTAALP